MNRQCSVVGEGINSSRLIKGMRLPEESTECQMLGRYISRVAPPLIGSMVDCVIATALVAIGFVVYFFKSSINLIYSLHFFGCWNYLHAVNARFLWLLLCVLPAIRAQELLGIMDCTTKEFILTIFEEINSEE